MNEPARSPFLPGTKIQFAWDSTSLGWLKTCPRLYQYFMIEGWTPRGEAVHLRYGQLYHSALERYDRLLTEGLSHDDALIETVQHTLIDTWDYVSCAYCEGTGMINGVSCTDCLGKGLEQGGATGKPWDSGHNTKTRETLIRSIIWYIEHFNDDPAATVILANGKPAVELSFRMELDWGPNGNSTQAFEHGAQPYLLCGHLDRVADYSGGKYVADRKTTGSALGSYFFDQFNPHNQMSLYTIAGKVVLDSPINGVIIDAAQIMVGFTRFGRGLTYRTEAQSQEWLNDLKFWLVQAEQYATADHWPMNDTACDKFGGCTFRGICSKDPGVRQKFLESHFDKRQWNPLEPR